MAAPVNRYRRRVLTWDALQYDGTNGADVVAFVGGMDYAKVEGEKVVLSLQGADIHSQKLDVMPTQWVLIPFRGGPFIVVGEGEFGNLWQVDEAGPVH